MNSFGDSGGVRFGAVPFDRDEVSQYLQSDEVTHVLIEQESRVYQLVLDYVAANQMDPSGSFSWCERQSANGLTAGLGMHRFSWRAHSLHCLRQTAGEPVGTQ